MALRPPGSLSRPAAVSETAFDALGYEILAEKAAALGRVGDNAASAIARLHACDQESPDRPALLREAARAVHAWFMREICGMRRHQDVIRELRIPREVLVRLGAS